MHHGTPLRYRGEELLAVTLRVARERALVDALGQHLGERGTWFHLVRRQLIHLVILRVADDQAFVGVEHAQTLRHAVDGGADLRDLAPLSADDHGVGQDHCGLCDDRGKDADHGGFRKTWNKSRRPTGGEDCERAITAGK